MNESVGADVDGDSLVPLDSVRSLGIIFDESANFLKHVNIMVRD